MDGIILLAKQPGLTSFTSLHQIKRAIKSTKVGHTGTLDNFAQGLLVVCTGRLTRLAGSITDFDKTYKAVIQFGQETDTLDYEGQIIKTADLPTFCVLKEKLPLFTGVQMQKPPLYSAIHVEGKRASDLARSGVTAELPERQINVYDAKILEVLSENGNQEMNSISNDEKISACMIEFTVSKGTYVRSLARDFAQACGSAGHLRGLYRTRVGSFNVEDSAFYDDLPEFSIKSCLKIAEERKKILALPKEPVKEKTKYDAEKDQQIYNQILDKVQMVDPKLALDCGFDKILHLVNEPAYDDFMNGRPLKNRLFEEDLYQIPNSTVNAVFAKEGQFAGLISKDEVGKIRYKLVIN